MPPKRKPTKKRKQMPNGYKEGDQTACLQCNQIIFVDSAKKVDGGWVCAHHPVSSKSELTKSAPTPYHNTRAGKISNSLISYKEKMRLNEKTVKEFAIKNTANLLDAKIALMGAVRLIEEETRRKDGGEG